jgi:hypothetical protein
MSVTASCLRRVKISFMLWWKPEITTVLWFVGFLRTEPPQMVRVSCTVD